MKQIQCKNGHYYDESLVTCPTCAKGGTVLLDRANTKKIEEEGKSINKKHDSKIDMRIVILLVVIVIMVVLIVFKNKIFKPDIQKVDVNTTVVVQESTTVSPDTNTTPVVTASIPAVANDINTTVVASETNSTVATNNTVTINSDVNTTSDTNTTAKSGESNSTDTAKNDVLMNIKQKFGKPSDAKEKSKFNFSGDK